MLNYYLQEDFVLKKVQIWILFLLIVSSSLPVKNKIGIKSMAISSSKKSFEVKGLLLPGNIFCYKARDLSHFKKTWV